MPPSVPAPKTLTVCKVLPTYQAVVVEGVSTAARCIVTSINNEPVAEMSVGDRIRKGTPIRLAWDLGQLPNVQSASALQTFCVADYFRVKATVVVIRGSAGTGKSYLRDRIVANLKRRGINTMCMAPTGLVAQSMPSGMWRGREYTSQTVAWYLRHPPTVPDGTQEKQLHVIVDEYTMVSSFDLDRLWEISLKLCPKVRITLIGDHAQLWPVKGLPPWSCERLKRVQRDGHMAVYRLMAQHRFGSCERMNSLVEALRSRKFNAASTELYQIAVKPPPTTGSCRLIAATHRLTRPANECVHKALALRGENRKTVFVSASGSEEDTISLCNGERVRVCSNKYEAQPGGGVTYTYANGEEGLVQGLPGGTVHVKKDTRIMVQLFGRNEAGSIQVAPRRCKTAEDSTQAVFDDDFISEDLEDLERASSGVRRPAKKARKKASSSFTYSGVLRPSSGQTAHSVQGSTFRKDERCVVDLAGFPRSIEGFHMLIVSLTRVQHIKNLFVLNFDPAMINELAESCPCGCVLSGPHQRAHSQARLNSYHDHMAALHEFNRAIFRPEP